MKKIIFTLSFSLLMFLPFVAKADLTTDYNTQRNQLEQQILDIKTKYYSDVASWNGSGADLQFVQGMQAKILNEANTQIAKIQLEEQQLALNYQTQLNAQLDVAQQKADQAKATLDDYNNSCVSNNGYIGADHNCYCNSGYTYDAVNKVCTQITCPPSSSFGNGNCFCNEGYIQVGSTCLTYTQNCQNKYGNSSYGDKNYCYCNTGYEWNSGNTACMVKAVDNTTTTVQEPVATPIIKNEAVDAPKPAIINKPIFKPTIKPIIKGNEKQKTDKEDKGKILLVPSLVSSSSDISPNNSTTTDNPVQKSKIRSFFDRIIIFLKKIKF